MQCAIFARRYGLTMKRGGFGRINFQFTRILI